MFRNIIMDFVGSHSTGKTTIIQQALSLLRTHKLDVNLVESVSRTELEGFGLKLYDETDDFMQSWISLNNWSRILESAMKHQVTLCTDFIVRSMAYTLSSPHIKPETVQVHKRWLDYISSKCFRCSFDVLWFYLPIEFPLEKDGVRKEDENFRKLVDQHVKYVFSSCKLPAITLSGDKSKRYVKLSETVEHMLHNRIYLK